jgi:hypothetical protein
MSAGRVFAFENRYVNCLEPVELELDDDGIETEEIAIRQRCPWQLERARVTLRSARGRRAEQCDQERPGASRQPRADGVKQARSAGSNPKPPGR